jgi:small-conductance mechanosensitive channel
MWQWASSLTDTGILLATTTKKAAAPPILDQQVQSVLLYLMKWMNVPKQYAPIAEWGLRFGLAFFIFLLFSVLARRSRIRAIVDWIDNKVGAIELTPADRSFFAFLAWAVMWLPGLILILYSLRLVGLLATVGISAGAVAAIAAAANRELIGNVFAGVTLQARRYVAPGDAIKIKDMSGTIRNIGLTSSSLEDYEGVVHFIPNSKLINETLTNYSLAEFRRARIDLWFDPEEVELSEVETVLGEVIAEAPGQKEGKEGFFLYGALNEKGQEVNLYLYFVPSEWSQNASKSRRLLLDKIDDSAIQIGVPQILVLQVEDE